MTTPPLDFFDKVPLPALVGIEVPNRICRAVRALTSEDQTVLEHARILYQSLKPIMTMFNIVNWNYDEFHSFTGTLTKDEPQAPHPMLKANRLLFNYIASADALLDHFARQYKAQCRAKRLPDTGFEKLRDDLKRSNDVFQFFDCFRNHVLHQSLPVGELSQTKSLTEGVGFSLTYSSGQLRDSFPREWGCCRLIRNISTIDLVHVVDEVQDIINGRILNAIVGCYRVDLDKAADCHRRLTDEVVTAFPNHRPAILRERIYSGNEFTWKMDALPPDLLKDLGICFGSPPSV